MGRIKTQQIKSKGAELFEKLGGRASKDFEENKQLVEKHATVQSKKLRNRLAGQLTKTAKKNR